MTTAVYESLFYEQSLNLEDIAAVTRVFFFHTNYIVFTIIRNNKRLMY